MVVLVLDDRVPFMILCLLSVSSLRLDLFSQIFKVFCPSPPKRWPQKKRNSPPPQSLYGRKRKLLSDSPSCCPFLFFLFFQTSFVAFCMCFHCIYVMSSFFMVYVVFVCSLYLFISCPSFVFFFFKQKNIKAMCFCECVSLVA